MRAKTRFRKDPHGRIRLQETCRHLEPKLPLVPRFRQRLYRPPWGLGRPLWVDAATFDLARGGGSTLPLVGQASPS